MTPTSQTGGGGGTFRGKKNAESSNGGTYLFLSKDEHHLMIYFLYLRWKDSGDSGDKFTLERKVADHRKKSPDEFLRKKIPIFANPLVDVFASKMSQLVVVVLVLTAYYGLSKLRKTCHIIGEAKNK